jgi:hypothetical protein
VLVSIGYSTCHWCHVMARESFSDPELASYLNENFVSVKVDREEHPDVDATYIAAASAFTQNLGWPLNVFVTPEGKAFYAGTYSPPQPIPGHASFRQVLEAVTDAWSGHRDEVDDAAAKVAEALAAAPARQGGGELPGEAALDAAIAGFAAHEDTTYGGFGGAPKFPASPTLGFLLSRDSGEQLALRTLKRMGASPLRDPVEGGFFRYAVNRDWSDPHYERMLYDNAQLLELYTQAWKLTGEQWAEDVARGVARFLTGVMQLRSGGFASAQDSESVVDGKRVEGGYYQYDEEDRARQVPPALDEKVLTGWNGLAIAALSSAGFAFDAPALTESARRAADHLIARHLMDDGTLVRASIGDRVSRAQATLEDFGMLARGLLELGAATGEIRYATVAKGLIDSTLVPVPAPASPGGAVASVPFQAPNGADPVLVAQGLGGPVDPSEGAYPSGLSAMAGSSVLLYLLTADRRYRDAAAAALESVAGYALGQPIAFGAALRVMSTLVSPVEQLVVVSPDDVPTEGSGETGGLRAAARRYSAGLVASVTDSQGRRWADAGFDLFEDRVTQRGLPTAYLCQEFVCRLPVTDPSELDRASEVWPAESRAAHEA